MNIENASVQLITKITFKHQQHPPPQTFRRILESVGDLINRLIELAAHPSTPNTTFNLIPWGGGTKNLGKSPKFFQAELKKIKKNKLTKA